MVSARGASAGGPSQLPPVADAPVSTTSSRPTDTEHLLFLEARPRTSLLSSCPAPAWELSLTSGSGPPSRRLANLSGMDAWDRRGAQQRPVRPCWAWGSRAGVRSSPCPPAASTGHEAAAGRLLPGHIQAGWRVISILAYATQRQGSSLLKGEVAWGAVNYVTLLPVNAVPGPVPGGLLAVVFTERVGEPPEPWSAGAAPSRQPSLGPRLCVCMRVCARARGEAWAADVGGEVGGSAAWRSQLGSLGAQG